jgi:GDP-4-dehydro-6-deoxy-D-mannose reductase
MGYQYYKSYGLRIIRTRAFNHSGPRRGDVFVDSNFAKQIAEIEAGKHPPVIEVGNLSAIRDFTDVRDIVSAYWLATEKCEEGEVYNICSGRGYAIKDVLQTLLSYSTTKNIRVMQDPKQQRPSDVPALVGDNSKFRLKTGWNPTMDYLTTTLRDTLEYWRLKTN